MSSKGSEFPALRHRAIRLVGTVMLITLAVLTFEGCPYMYPDYEPLSIVPSVAPLQTLNTEYDDYNMAGPPWFAASGEFVYSTNVGSSGADFDIWLGRCDLSLLSMDDGFPIGYGSRELAAVKVQPYGGNTVNTEGDEYGPFLWYENDNNNDPTGLFPDLESAEEIGTLYLFFASTSGSVDGTLDLYVYDGSGEATALSINAAGADDAYLCYGPETGTALFCSDRGGDFDIYSVSPAAVSGDGLTFPDMLVSAETALVAEPVAALNSDYDDKCPFICDNIVVFVSNRDTAGGTFDIYISHYESGAWSAPTRFPDLWHAATEDTYTVALITESLEESSNEIMVRTSDGSPVPSLLINTEYDEYRPYLFRGYGTATFVKQPFGIIFSSNRSGGEGGFDLYFALVPGEYVED